MALLSAVTNRDRMVITERRPTGTGAVTGPTPDGGGTGGGSAIDNISGTGFTVRTSTGWVTRQLTAPAAGLTIANNTGVAGNATFALANDLAGVESISGTGIAARTATDTWTTRSIVSTSSSLVVTNGDGVSGNPSFALAAVLQTLGQLANSGGVLTNDGSGGLSWATAGGGVGGSTGSTDNALIRADGTGGATVQSSSVIVDDSGNLSSGGTEAGAAFYFERASWAVGKLKSTGADALFQMQRASSGNSAWIQFQTPGWTSEWRAGLAWSGLISGGDTFAISYFDGTERAFFQLDGDGRVKTRPRGTGTVTALDITAANADYMQFVLGKDSTHQLQAEWDSVNNQGIFSSYNNSYPILIRGSELRFNTNSNDRLTINNSGALRLHAYGAGTLVTDSSGNVTAASASTLRTNLGIAHHQQVTVDGSGNVGIGGAPGKKLDINVSHAVSQEIEARLASTTGGGNYYGLGLRYGLDGAGAPYRKLVTYHGTSVYDNLVFDSSGNVGIGGHPLASKLRVVGLPTSSAGLASGDVWNDAGTLKVV